MTPAEIGEFIKILGFPIFVATVALGGLLYVLRFLLNDMKHVIKKMTEHLMEHNEISIQILETLRRLNGKH